jgi:hypothetical protein
MKFFRTSAMAVILTIASSVASTAAWAQGERCAASFEQYRDYVADLTKASAASRAAADINPILEADAGYYTVELTAAKRCLVQLKPAAVAVIR